MRQEGKQKLMLGKPKTGWSKSLGITIEHQERHKDEIVENPLQQTEEECLMLVEVLTHDEEVEEPHEEVVVKEAERETLKRGLVRQVGDHQELLLEQLELLEWPEGILLSETLDEQEQLQGEALELEDRQRIIHLELEEINLYNNII